MTEQNASTQTAQTSEAGASTSGPTLDQRAAALAEQLEARPPPEAAAGASDTNAPDDPGSSPAAASGGGAPAAPQQEPSPAERARADRHVRLQAARAKERAADEERQRKRQRRQEEGEVERLRKEAADLRAKEDRWSRLAKDPAELLSFAEESGMTLEQVVNYIKLRTTNPSALAQHEAQRQASTVEQRLQAKLDAVEKRLAESDKSREEERRQAEAQVAAVRAANAFVGMAEQSAKSHPLTAALLGRVGGERLVEFANSFIVPAFQDGNYGDLETLHDQTETFLENLQLSAPPQTTQQGGTSHPPKKNGAAKPVTTLSNDVVSERPTVTEEVPFHRLPLDERAQRLREQLESGEIE